MNALALVGLLVAVTAHIWIVVLCFRAGLLWGLGSLVFPPTGLLFCLLSLRDTWRPLLLQVAGLALLFYGLDQAAVVR